MMNWRVRGARMHDAMGTVGLLGVALLFAAAIWLATAWNAHRVLLAQPEPAAPSPAVLASAPVAPAVTAPWPKTSETALVLTLLKQTVVDQGVAWPSADYKLLPATPQTPATLEVRCALKSAYPQLRGVIAQLRNVPGLAIRELSLVRPNADTPDLEAKLTLAVFLREDNAASTQKPVP